MCIFTSLRGQHVCRFRGLNRREMKGIKLFQCLFDVRQSHQFFKEHCPWQNKVEWHKETKQGKNINWGVELEMSGVLGNRRLTKREMKNLSCPQRSYNSLVLLLISEYCTKRNSDIQKTSFILNTFNFHYPQWEASISRQWYNYY